MRLPTDPAKLKLYTREYIMKHCRALEKKFEAFKNQLVNFTIFLYSQAPLFCTHGKNELDCMKPNSPCKRRHQKDCPLYLRISKIRELFEMTSIERRVE